MDEVFGYFPPTANPPSKTPMLTLLKQARAFGLGVVLATQNPVDLDYKGLSNAGTWFLGRLQTERDKARVLEGLEGASAQAGSQFDRAPDGSHAGRSRAAGLPDEQHARRRAGRLPDPVGAVLPARPADAAADRRGDAGAESRSAGRGRPVAASVAAAPGPATAVSSPAAAPAEAPVAVPAASQRPLVPPDVTERFLARKSAPGGSRLVYRPAVLGNARLHYVEAKTGVDEWRSVVVLAAVGDETPTDVWQDAELWEEQPDFDAQPEQDAAFAALPPELAKPKSYAAWGRALKDACYRDQPLKRWSCPALKLLSKADEAEADFRVQVRQAAREQRDAQVEKLRAAVCAQTAHTDSANPHCGRPGAPRAVSVEHKAPWMRSCPWAARCSAQLFGRKLASVSNVTRAGRAMKGMGRSMKERGDVKHAEEPSSSSASS